MQAAIGYLRVSTREQGRSGLGLAAQRHEIEAFGKREGFSIKSWHQDVQTGAGADALIRRPGLAAALKESQAKCWPLIVSKLDRLSRNVHLISGLMEYRVHFVVAQLGKDRDDFTLHIWARLAEHERTMRAELCKKALAAAKARGVKLGQAARSKGHQRRVSAIAAVAIQEAAMQRAETFRPHVDWVLLQPGAKGRPITYQAAADKLNERNISAPNGGLGNGNMCATLHGDWGCEGGYVVGRGSRGTHAFGHGLVRSGGEREKVNRCWVFACQYTGTRP